MENKHLVNAFAETTNKMFGRNVRAVRTARNLTQEELARELAAAGAPMSQSTIAKLERGARPTTIAEVTALATVLGVTISELLAIGADSEDVVVLAHCGAERAFLLEELDRNDRDRKRVLAESKEILNKLELNKQRRDEVVLGMRAAPNAEEYRAMGLDLRTSDEIRAEGGGGHGEHQEEA